MLIQFDHPMGAGNILKKQLKQELSNNINNLLILVEIKSFMIRIFTYNSIHESLCRDLLLMSLTDFNYWFRSDIGRGYFDKDLYSRMIKDLNMVHYEWVTEQDYQGIDSNNHGRKILILDKCIEIILDEVEDELPSSDEIGLEY